MEQEDLFEIKITLKEEVIKEAIRDYLSQRGYDVLDYNFLLNVREERQDMGLFSRDLVCHHFKDATVNVKRLSTKRPTLSTVPKLETQETPK